MAMHGFHSAYPEQRFQSGASDTMVQFFNHEAWIEDDEVAAELDKIIATGKVPHITRINISDIEKEAAVAVAAAEALKKKASLLAASRIPAAVTSVMTTKETGAVVADSLSDVSAPASKK